MDNGPVTRDDDAPASVPAFNLEGQTAALARATDWAATPLGPVSRWSPALRAAVGICLASRFPMLVAWGPERVLIYNDAYLPVVGPDDHPAAFGSPGRGSSGDAWAVLEPMLDVVKATGVATCAEDVRLPLKRNGAIEEAYFAFSCSAVHGEHREVAGVFVAVTDGTARVLAARQVSQAIARERAAAGALAREQAVLAEVIELAPAGICLWWGDEHRFRLVNRRYQELVGVQDPVGRRLVDVLPDVAPIALPALDAVRSSGLPESYEDLPLPFGGDESVDGDRYYSFDLSAVPDEDGGPGGVLGVTVETTDAVRRRGRLEAELLSERRIAETLQRALLPPRLPELPGARLAARYEAAGERFQVGGDFYDAFENADGTWTLIVGDVQGKGPRAAAVTAMARYTVRAEAAHGGQPGRLVAMLNRELCRRRRSPDAAFCTLACATLQFSDSGARMRIAVAGHPAPLVLRAGRGPSVLGATGPLVGVIEDATFNEVSLPLTPGDAVVFYTDGLTEARAPHRVLEPIDLAASLALSSGRSADQLVSRLAAELPDSEQLRDDYAILALSMDPRAAPADVSGPSR